MQDGAVFLVFGNHGLQGSACCLAGLDYVQIFSLPTDQGEKLAKSCLETIKQWARTEGYTKLIITSPRLNGSSFAYFEKELGFRRNSVIYHMAL
jgi:GNAT superfamily N-acetyltransferase